MLEIVVKDKETEKIIAKEDVKYIQAYAICVEDGGETTWPLSYGEATDEELYEVCDMMNDNGFKLRWDNEARQVKIIAKGREISLGD